MTWHYQLFDCGNYLAVHELYTDEDGEEYWTEEPSRLLAETLEDFNWMLAQVQSDIKKYGIRKMPDAKET